MDRAIDITVEAGGNPIVVNTHYLADQMEAHLSGTSVKLVHETPLILETGGGLRNALPVLGVGETFTLNPDCLFLGPNPLKHLAEAWTPGLMKALLLVVPMRRARAFSGKGDFDLTKDGLLNRGTDLVFSGAQIIDTSILPEIGETAFSLNVYWDWIAANGGLHGVIYPGEWCDVGHPSGLAKARGLVQRTSDV